MDPLLVALFAAAPLLFALGSFLYLDVLANSCTRIFSYLRPRQRVQVVIGFSLMLLGLTAYISALFTWVWTVATASPW